MYKSPKKEYELDRTYDFSKDGSPTAKRFVKKRSHRRYRQKNKCETRCEVNKEENIKD